VTECPHCKRGFPDSYDFTRDGRLNPFAVASAANNFKVHVAACGRKKGKPAPAQQEPAP
jgi:hypothetical protein